MDILVKRIFSNTKYTIGHLYVDGTYVCDTLEDTDRGFNQYMSYSWIQNQKVIGETAIPVGTYRIDMSTVSPRFVQKAYYAKLCDGKLPRLVDVPGFEGILIHTGNTASETCGCLLTGYNKEKGKILNSKQAFEKLYAILDEANKRGEEIYITITRTYKF